MIKAGDRVKRDHNGEIYTVMAIAENIHGIHDGWLQITLGVWVSPTVVEVVEEDVEED